MCGYTTVYFYLLVHHLMLYNVDDKSTALCFTLVSNSDINKFQLLMSVSSQRDHKTCYDFSGKLSIAR